MSRMSRPPLAVLRRKLAKVPILSDAYRFVREQISPHRRILRRIRRETPGLLLQPSPFTVPDRHPHFFAQVAKRLEQNPAPRILSFGCSAGDEVFTLRRYFPRAELVGIDINPRAIARCKRRLEHAGGDAAIRFCCAGSTTGEPDDHFDAIFCLSVLRHGDLEATRPERCDAILPFADVERTVVELSRCLKPGGFCVIWHCHFRLSDMSVSWQYETVMTDGLGKWANSPLYGPDNQRLDGVQWCDAVFCKRGQGRDTLAH